MRAAFSTTGRAHRRRGRRTAHPPSELDALRKENELLKLNLQVVLEKLRTQDASKQGDAEPKGDESLKRFAAVASRFKYKIPFETGATDFKDDARIEILEVWGTRPKIEIGGQYLVHGKYTLPSRDGTLYFHETASAAADALGTDLDLQYTSVQKGQGEFTLVHGMSCAGSFHLSLIGAENQKSYEAANVYFGTGDNVYRKTP